MKTYPRPLSLLVLFGTLLVTGCVTHIRLDQTQNPPPAEAFSNFTHVEIKPIVLPSPYAGQAANEKARRKIQDNVDADTRAFLGLWKKAPPATDTARTLVIEPRITEIKFINATSRVWAGAIAGSSAVVLSVTNSEKETGTVVARPVFYARAQAMGGAFSFGATDNLMLTRVAKRFTDYLSANYSRAVGGPTGAEPAK